MSLRLKDKVAIVTGSSKGIGASIAENFAAEGAAVTVNYSSDKAGAEKVVEKIKAKGGKAIAVQASVVSKEEVQKLFEETKKAFGHIDVLVNNAGMYAFEALGNITQQSFEQQFNLNVFGIILTCQEAVKQFPESGGTIINISALSGTKPVEHMSVYAATKGAVNTLSQVLAVELAPQGIRVNVVAPGPVETETFSKTGFVGSEYFEQNIIAKTPLKRIGQPEDIAKVAIFLASGDAAWVTGERITVSGGLL
ncbi:MAG TPA: glucose 1-dehydrogenase [Arachidicoccus sp.]